MAQKLFYGSSAKNGCGRGCHMALPYGSAIWLCHMVLPCPKFWSKIEKVRSSKKKWDLFQLPNIGLVTHDDLLKISIWPRLDKHVLTTPRCSTYMTFMANLTKVFEHPDGNMQKALNCVKIGFRKKNFLGRPQSQFFISNRSRLVLEFKNMLKY